MTSRKTAAHFMAPWAFVVLALAVHAPLARADGGTVCYAGQLDGLQITIMTAPVPPRVGPVDISVLVQDLANKPWPDVPVLVRAYSSEAPHQVVEGIATTQASRNKVFRTAELVVPAPGPWNFEVLIQGRAGPTRIDFNVEVGAPIPAWLDLGPWIGWPLVAVALFGLHLFLAHRRQRVPGRANTSPRLANSSG